MRRATWIKLTSPAALKSVAAEHRARREKLALSGGHLLSAAFQFLGELLPAPSNSSGSKSAANSLAATLKQSFSDLVEHDEHGRPRLSFVLPDATALDGLTNVLARLIARTESA